MERERFSSASSGFYSSFTAGSTNLGGTSQDKEIEVSIIGKLRLFNPKPLLK